MKGNGAKKVESPKVENAIAKCQLSRQGIITIFIH
jgi:hypothetical protein